MNYELLAQEYFEREDIKKQAIADLSEIIAVNSVASSSEEGFPFGRECARALDVATGIAVKYGFEVINHDYRCLSVLFGEGDYEVGIVTHLDIVPATDGWETDPFTLTDKGGLLIGRGAHDDKGPFIQSLYTIRFFKENNIKLPFRVRLILGSDEEVGSSDLAYFQTVCRAPWFSFTPDSEYPVCIGEKGIAGVNVNVGKLPVCIRELSGGTVANAVPFEAHAEVVTESELCGNEAVTLEKTEQGYIVTAHGKPAHAAMPEQGVNAIGLLAAYLLENRLCEGNERGFEFLASACSEYLGKTLGIGCDNPDFGYLTCVGGVIGVRDGNIVQNFNIRYTPEFNGKTLFEAICIAVGDYGLDAELVSASEGYFVSADDDRIRALTTACESVLGIPCEPYTMGGGTYARSLPNTVAFGSGIVSERTRLGEGRGGPHQRDEYISHTEFFGGMNIFVRSLLNLSSVNPTA